MNNYGFNLMWYRPGTTEAVIEDHLSFSPSIWQWLHEVWTQLEGFIANKHMRANSFSPWLHSCPRQSELALIQLFANGAVFENFPITKSLQSVPTLRQNRYWLPATAMRTMEWVPWKLCK